EAEIITWHVKAGDTVAVDQGIVEVETAKAVVEVPVPFAGRVTQVHGQPGDVVAVGQPLVTVEAAEPGFAEPGVVTSPAAAQGPAGPAEDGPSGNVLIGYGTSTGHRRRRRAAGGRPGPSPAPAPGDRVAVASPLIRQRARNAGVDITALRGSGRGGLITRQDVDAAIDARRPATAPGITRVPIRGPRKAAADKLSRSRREIPDATVWVDVDATELVGLRAALNAGPPAPQISLLALVARFTVLALRRYPELNATIDGGEIVMSAAVHLGFAAQTGRGLMVPVVRDAQALSLEQLSIALAERTVRARDGDLSPAELTGGTFTVNNYGVFGVDGSAAIINHPEVAILGLGRIIQRPWVAGGQIVPRHMTELTLAFDHRVCDGGTAGGFLRFIADCVESPATALRHL
ncbi:MAG TPA: dihydrolipoamide acetyltransferase family protein, partial [Streptosporangiaceae bacterium]